MTEDAFVCDLHTHSRFFHRPAESVSGYDYLGVRLARQVARLRGLSGIAVTNHDYYRPETFTSFDRCLPGIEISTTMGHVLVVGPDPPTRTAAGEITPTEAVDLAHDRGCAAIIAHPFRGSRVIESDADFDAVEINGKRPENREHIEQLARERDLPIVGGSDAHFPFEVGRAATRIDVDDLTPEAVVRAIKAGDVEPVVQHGHVDEGMRNLYRRIHTRKYDSSGNADRRRSSSDS